MTHTARRCNLAPPQERRRSHDNAFSTPVLVLAPAMAIDLAVRWRRPYGMLVAALCIGPALLVGEWGYRGVFGASVWAPLEVAASLTVITVAVALGGLAGDRLAALLRCDEQPC